MKDRIKNIILFILLALFIGSCQNRNQVTHNKRKYNKGYYKPKRVKVKHQKFSQEQKLTYNSNSKSGEEYSNDEQAKKRFRSAGSKTEDFTQKEEKKTIPKNQTNDEVRTSDQITVEDEPKRSSGQNIQRNDIQNEVLQDDKKKKKVNWIYWVSLALLFSVLALGVLTFVMVYAALAWLIILLLCIILALVIFGLIINVLNILKLEKNKTVEQKFLLGNSYFFAIFFSLGVIAVIVFLLSIIL